jgi:hypothetical protein
MTEQNKNIALQASMCNMVAYFLAKMNPDPRYQEAIRTIHEEILQELHEADMMMNRRFKYHPAGDDPPNPPKKG